MCYLLYPHRLYLYCLWGIYKYGCLCPFVCSCPTFVSVFCLSLSYVFPCLAFVSVLRLSLSCVCFCPTFVPLSYVCFCPTFVVSVLRLSLSFCKSLSYVWLYPTLVPVLRLSMSFCLSLSYVCLCPFVCPWPKFFPVLRLSLPCVWLSHVCPRNLDSSLV